MNKIPTARFTEFIEYFPLLEPPFSLLSDISEIPSSSLPLPAIMLEEFILPFEGDEADEFTEYIPYCRISGTKGFQALIYWKASVLKYEFILATYGDDGHLISHAIVGGLLADKEGILHSVAIINKDLTIIIAEGLTVSENVSLDLKNTNTYQMAILPDGFIRYDLNEEDR
ncbi:MAG: hypothetical protein ABIQ02_13950 [Saprospiraceae bacterium]